MTAEVQGGVVVRYLIEVKIMYHRMYLRRSSMSSISEESEMDDDDQLSENFMLNNKHVNEKQNALSINLNVKNCLGDLNIFKEEIRDAYEELSTLERQARNKTTISPRMCNINQENDLDILLDQLYKLEQRLDDRKMFHDETNSSKKKSISSTIIEQFDELDQTLATLTNTLNNIEIEFVDSGNSSSSSAISDLNRNHHQGGGSEEHFSDSGLSQSTDSINLPLISQQISNASSVISCDTLKNSYGENQIRLALEKIHEANIKKIFVKIYNEDQSTKNILIDETMSIYQILILLFHKYHLKPTINYSIVEDLPDLHIYRIFEDHQNLINDGLIYWSRDTHNRICFQEYENKYMIFQEPKKFYSTNDKIIDDILIDYISSDTIILPDNITSILYIKDKNRKIWKKYTCILRQSGIYQIPKSSSTKQDLICLLKFDSNIQLYYANNWIESLRSPTSYGFALKPAHIQKKSNKYIHYLCANTYDEYQRWINGIRIILYGVQLYENYQQMTKVIDDEIDNLVNLLPNQHYFNFITPTTSVMQQSTSSISLPINQIVSDSTDTHKTLIDIDSTSTKYMSYSLGMLLKFTNSFDRLKTSKTSFTRSSSFHSSLRSSKTNRTEEKIYRTKSTSPPDTSPVKTHGLIFKRSKSAKEISSQSSSIQRPKSNRISSSSSIIPFINQCIQPDKARIHIKPPKRPPPPIPSKPSPSISNHIYDSLQDTPILTNESNRTVTMSRLLPVRVTEL
ncbi:unnamed protein product [Rotaria sp. Silwood2]|nr:unnamed protein product [Rotaria sp. Silwood2]CAF3202286.1 unnamed protein product [Rotaria sp. Silwood2]CAF4032856.1 unnamed protein product [Rotaria sp. Silwood2]CAF4110916.1 unnamed protein product [Rotaria sp. Silwood2]